MNAFFFWLFSGGMIIFALAVVLNRNAVASALCFTFSIVFMAGLFVMLSAFFLAAVQILVTAGAVMVLFLFIIMLLDLTAMEHMPRQKIWMGFTLVVALAFLGLVAKTLTFTPHNLNHTIASEGSEATPINHPQVLPDGTTVEKVVSQEDWDKHDDTHEIGRLLFRAKLLPGETSYIAPFEITSLLILVATVGVIVLCKQDDRPRPRTREQISREAPPIEPKKEPALKG